MGNKKKYEKRRTAYMETEFPSHQLNNNSILKRDKL